MLWHISVITVHKNHRAQLALTLDSVQEQTYPHLEHIIIDGGSTDGSVALIKENASRLSYWVSEPDAGIYAAMNKGVRAATGDYLLFLNAGDTFLGKQALEQAVAKLPVEPIDIIYGRIVSETSRGRKLVQRYPRRPTLQYLAWKGFCHQAMFFHSSLFAHLQYDESLKVIADWKLYIHAIVLHGATTHYLDFAFSCFRYGGFSSLPENRRISQMEREAVLQIDFPEDYPKLRRRKNYQKWLHRLSGYAAIQYLRRKIFYLWLRIQGK